ncbi:MAG: urea transporter [Janthinobacterium lividum]
MPIKYFRQNFLQAMLNSYSMVFFSQHNFLAVMLLLCTFFHPFSGFVGFLSVVLTVLFLNCTSHPQENIKSGIYSFNALLLGIGFSSFYQFNRAFCVWILVVLLVNALLTVILFTKTNRYNLPVLSLPFIFSFWLILLAANGFSAMGLRPSNLVSLHEILAENEFSHISTPFYVDLFLRSLSAVIFQNNLWVGIFISIGLFVHSRIAFSLLILGFTTACLFNHFTGIFPEGISFYYLGGNFMMVALATGGFFLVPSARSYIWAVLSVLICFLLLLALSKILIIWYLPLFSMPFCIVSLLLIGFFRLRIRIEKPTLTSLQHYSPETNLYLYSSHQKRLQNLQFIRLQLPFMGGWAVSQGYNGTITHQGEWAQALDFVVEEEGKTYCLPGSQPEHFYCYNKPVLAVADGRIEDVVDEIADNLIGEENLMQNWGNSIVIKHLDGLYSQVSHLKKGSAKVQKGDLVKQGTIIGYCGNSGRSPEPHLHFQMQTTPFVGSKTMSYPFAYYLENSSTQTFKSFEIPAEKEVIKTVSIQPDLKRAFTFLPGFRAKIITENQTENWEVYSNTLHQNYFFSKETGAAAFFINDGNSFYFTSFYGDQQSLLYGFFLAAYRVIFSVEVNMEDEFPLSISNNKPKLWLQDLIAPFYQFISYGYQSKSSVTAGGIAISAKGFKQVFNHQKPFFEAVINIREQQITGFEISISNKKIQATWLTANIY